ncbi:hypothetical protein AWC38_SpisGene9755 [Stylophora pistillata]|uniref:Reverse transcriptase domain-containing protein n=1 Tax=Stylophora pistillata TaxID=50429 RepID=A0A2B4S4G9_STYPI|nr:hypothetical protein AWC38_SpisGene9755 [Stylophora pistillata]
MKWAWSRNSVRDFLYPVSLIWRSPPVPLNTGDPPNTVPQNRAEEIQNLVIDQNDIFVSFDVTSLFTNVPLQETIGTIAEKAFVDNWFNVTHNLNITKPDPVRLLEVATINQLFQFDGKLYEQIDSVAMGFPLGPLVANAFLCSIEEKLEQDNKLPEFYRRPHVLESHVRMSRVFRTTRAATSCDGNRQSKQSCLRPNKR